MAAKTFTDWLSLEKHAQESGYDKLEFMGFFPAGPIRCKFLDAYLGLVSIDGVDGFVRISDLDAAYPGITCITITDDEVAL